MPGATGSGGVSRGEYPAIGPGGYVIAHSVGPVLRKRVKLSRGVDGTPQVEIVDVETLRRNAAL